MKDRAFSKVVLATTNEGKAKEFYELLRPFGLTVESLKTFEGMPPVKETGETFAANALLKARAAMQHTELPAIADDSGISVDVLDGRPGVYSARYAGERATDEQNVRRLLHELENIQGEQRSARFVCSLAFVDPTGVEITAEGILSGYVTITPAGNQGFGYDPVFKPVGSDLTLAEISPQIKNEISHRNKALTILIDKLIENGLINTL